ncbi:uncharacterized protein L969DRAFT_97566 [Mixia osmundae IAM 14324]|uniref:RRM domain-containing protein n=1 Tax=Mixia osmundae (strain CBS 9802 / IAM 14324 / JCM 22182 / KY 12970) TaxID=764103 RepID=G7DWQ2_MIXOS|nr:uncharacterized protein L969DRAFT_97566 [Mixia osmundae IAM 14324]KEI36222.1 hypothetical protein L969DRAFT_97566 [Mixia osmundae IAM 14324]GAA94999.1 hypothetical protein E5Q_01654 [Mixia osmundae IAM 14324]
MQIDGGNRRHSRPASRGRSYSDRSEPSKGDSDAPWKHDLFDPLSNLYQPILHQRSGTFGRDRPGPVRRGEQEEDLFARPTPKTASASLRPFGSATQTPPAPSPYARPASASNDSRAAMDKKRKDLDLARRKAVEEEEYAANQAAKRVATAQVPSTAQAPGSLSLMARVQQSLFERMGMQDPNPKPQNRPARARAEQANRSQDVQEGNSMDVDMVISPAPVPRSATTSRKPALGPATVLIRHLVDGTTAEDIKTAFSDYGTILSSKILNPGSPDLDAEVIFKLRVHAETAASALDGAIADGKRLSVTVQRPPQLAPSPKTLAIQRPQNGAKPQTPIAPVIAARELLSQPPSRLRSDAILALDPRASRVTQPIAEPDPQADDVMAIEMDGDDAVRPASEVRRGRGGRRGRGRGRHEGSFHNDSANNVASKDLRSRLGF